MPEIFIRQLKTIQMSKLEMKYFFAGILICNTICIQAKIKIAERDSLEWERAKSVCGIYKELLLPDLGEENLKSMIPTDEFIWINAKTIHVAYPKGVYAYLKYAFYPANSELTSYLCQSSKELKWEPSPTPLSWHKAAESCKQQTAQLYNLTQPKQIRWTISLLQNDTRCWIGNVTEYSIPNIADSESIEWCVGAVKLSNGSVIYAKDNCSHSHKVYCLQLDEEKFVPTLTKLPKPLTDVWSDIDNQENDTLTDYSGENTKMSSVYGGIGGAVSVLLIAIGILAACCFVKRRSTQDDYMKRLHRYTERHNSIKRRIISGGTNTNTGSTICGNSYVDNQLDQTDHTVPSQSYEDCEQAKYSDCQKDVIKECNRLLITRYSKDPVSQSSSANRPRQDSYYAMDPKDAVKVLPCYEKFDPDIDHLQQAHSYINKSDEHDLAKIDCYENYDRNTCTLNAKGTLTPGPGFLQRSTLKSTGTLPKIPVKVKKTADLNSLDAYENQNIGTQKKQPSGTDADHGGYLKRLDSYENYSLPPKRNNGKYRYVKAHNNTEHMREAVGCATDIAGMKDIDEYESYEQPVSRKEVKSIDDLDAYENFANMEY